MPKKLTYEYVKDYIENGIGLHYELLSKEYFKNSAKLHIRCNNGHEFFMCFSALQHGQKCPYCSRYSFEEVKQYIESCGYKLLSKEFINTKERIEIMCPEGHIFFTTFNRFHIAGSRCKKCSTNKQKHTYDFVKNEIESVDGYKLLSDVYENEYAKLEIQCHLGHIFKTSFNSFYSGKRRCPECYNLRNRLTYEEVKFNIESIEGYKLLSQSYHGANKKLKIQCPEGHIFSMSYSAFHHQGQRCTICNESKGESRIRKYLSGNYVEFLPQKEFDGLLGLNNGNLSYDFYLPQYNILIEYQGEQHERPIDFLGEGKVVAKKRFKKQLKHDEFKREYAKKNNIKLLEIWYRDFENIEEILWQELKI